MSCVDTSVWVAALRARDSAAGCGFDRLLDHDEAAVPEHLGFIDAFVAE